MCFVKLTIDLGPWPLFDVCLQSNKVGVFRILTIHYVSIIPFSITWIKRSSWRSKELQFIRYMVYTWVFYFSYWSFNFMSWIFILNFVTNSVCLSVRLTGNANTTGLVFLRLHHIRWSSEKRLLKRHWLAFISILWSQPKFKTGLLRRFIITFLIFHHCILL